MMRSLAYSKSLFWKFMPALMLMAGLQSASGQAWVPEKGTGDFSTSYNYLSSQGHLGVTGGREPEAAALAQNALFEVDYGITDRLALTVFLPIVTISYNDTNPPPQFLRGLFDQAKQSIASGTYTHDFLDDGSYHTSLQDLHIDARYNVALHPLVVTPFVAFVIPSHDYAYVGEASPGRNLKEFQFGANLGRQLNPLLRKAYVQSRIAFTIPEAAMNIRTTRMNIDSELGYNFTRRFAVRGIGSWQYTFSGISSLDQLTTPELELTHERLLRNRYWHAGGGVSFALNSKTEVSADYITFVSGRVTHYGNSLSIGISRSFSIKGRRAQSTQLISERNSRERPKP
jgi:hypothetical protein